MKAPEKITLEIDVVARGLPGDREREVRTFNLTETRFESREDGTRRITGHAAVFDQWSEDLGGFREQIARGAFADAIGRDDVRALFNHDTSQVLGRNKSGTLTLLEDERGLLSEIILPDTSLARDLEVLMKRGDINQMSFAFSVSKDGQDWQKKGDGDWERTITRVARLYDVSVVTFPAYPQTDAAVREMESRKLESLAAAVHERKALDTLIFGQQQRLRLAINGL